MDEFDKLIVVLEHSVKKHGEKPLTNLWLLRCMKMVIRAQEKEDERSIIVENQFEIDQRN